MVGSKLYAGWTESDGSGSQQVRVAVYNGNDGAPSWTSVAGDATDGLNYSSTASTLDLGVMNSKLYAVWHESSGIGAVDETRLAVYNGNDLAPAWTFIDGNGNAGINIDNSKSAFDSRLINFNNKLYCTWAEANGVASQIRIAVGQ